MSAATSSSLTATTGSTSSTSSPSAAPPSRGRGPARVATGLVTSVLALTLLAACGSESDDPGSGTDPTQTAPTQTVPTGPASTDPVPPETPEETAVPSDLEDVTAQARTMLAEQLGGVAEDEIAVIHAMPVEWTSSALGCAEEGMGYLDVITSGYRLELQHGGTVYAFHGKDRQPPFYCEKPTDPIVPGT